jgi:hypothetical protein
MAEDYTKYNTIQLLKRWDTEGNMDNRDKLYKVMEERKLFPQEDMDKWEENSALYPATDDPKFIEKLLSRQEFAENLQDSIGDQQARGVNPCDSQEEFELTPVQRFISRFLSPQSPYVSALLYHGVGVGKTCAAITTAEEYLHSYPSESVFIVAPRNIQPGFRRTIYDDESLIIGTDSTPNDLKGCTGNLYLKRNGLEFEREKSIITRRINHSINSRYTILGYIQFYRYIQNILDTVPKSLPDERRAQEEIKALRREFSGRLVIIDEAHNLRDAPGETDADNLDVAGGDAELTEAKAGKRLTPSLIRVIKAAEGMKLMLLTGTPMYNSYREIIFLLNLLLLNDKRPPLSERDIFTPTGDFRPADPETGFEGGEKRLGIMAGAYISFMRGENPLTFPVRLDPTNVTRMTTWPEESPQGEAIFNNDDPKTERTKRTLLRLPFIPVKYEPAELKIIQSIADSAVEKSGLGVRSIDEMVQSGNWLFPVTDKDALPESRIRDIGFDSCFEESKGTTLSQFTSRSVPMWLSKTQIQNVSPKAHFILNRAPKAKGVIFIYSRFIKAGAIPLAISLEANGYTPWGRDKPLFGNGIVDGKGRQCALCEAREKEHAGKPHGFVPAKYVLLTGQMIYSPNNAAAIQAARSIKNTDGSEVKIVLGSQVASEGIDLRFIREIYVFDSWFHLNKMEQVLGRGVRTCSHSLLPETKRNCTIYLLVNSYGNNIETVDLYMYRSAMNKAIQMGQVTRVLKQYAIDCNLNRSAIIHSDLRPLDKIEDSQGEPREAVSLNDTPFTSICDWMECSYSCATPVDVKKLKKESKVSMISYDEYAMRWRESQIKQIIKSLFEDEQQPMIQIDSLIETLRAADIPAIAIRTILSEIVDQPSFNLTINGQQGYITYRNTYYLFQPFRLADSRIPIALRIANTIVRKDEYELSKMVIERPLVPKKKDGERAVAEAVAEEGTTAEEPKAEAKEVTETAVEYWNQCAFWANSIKDGSSDLDIPPDLLGVLYKRYKGDLYKHTYNYLSIFSWMFENIKISTEYDDNTRKVYQTALGRVLLELVWDEHLTSEEQKTILKEPRTEDIKIAAAEQLVKRGEKEIFRSVSLTTGKIEYICDNNERCSEILVRTLESDRADPYNNIQANNVTTGPIYGFLIPKIKDARIVFKTNDRQVGVGTPPEKGGECEIVSSIETHKKGLRAIRDMITDAKLKYPTFLLTDSVLNEKEIRGTLAKKEKVEAGASIYKKVYTAALERGVAKAEAEILGKNAKTKALEKSPERFKIETKLSIDSRKFQNVIKACALKNIILRLIDILEKEKGQKRYFYRPISAMKSNHRLK